MTDDLRGDIRAAIRDLEVPDDEINEAISIIRRAGKVLEDKELMRAIKRRRDEQRAAGAAAGKDNENAD